MVSKITKTRVRARRVASKMLWLPFIANACVFAGNILIAVTDGVIDDKELHTLTQHASAFEMVTLALVMVALRLRR